MSTTSVCTIFEFGRRRSAHATLFFYLGIYFLIAFGILFLSPSDEMATRIRNVALLYGLGIFSIPIVMGLSLTLVETWLESAISIDPKVSLLADEGKRAFGFSVGKLVFGLLLGIAAVGVFRQMSIFSLHDSLHFGIATYLAIFAAGMFAGMALHTIHLCLSIMQKIVTSIEVSVGHLRDGISEANSCVSKCYLLIAICWIPYAAADALSQRGFVKPWIKIFGAEIYPIFFLVGLPISIYLVVRYFDFLFAIDRKVSQTIRSNTALLAGPEKTAFKKMAGTRSQRALEEAGAVFELRETLGRFPNLSYNKYELIMAQAPAVLPILAHLLGPTQ